MKRLLIAVSLFSVCAFAQGNTTVIPYSGAPPSGAGKCVFSQLANNIIGGTFYYCDASTGTWTQAAAGGTVGTVNGTAGQITSTNPSGPTITLSIPDPFIPPQYVYPAVVTGSLGSTAAVVTQSSWVSPSTVAGFWNSFALSGDTILQRIYPSGNSTATLQAGAGVDAGTHYYVPTFVINKAITVPGTLGGGVPAFAREAETQLNAVSNTVTTAGGNLQISVVTACSTDARVVGVNWYRSIAGGGGGGLNTFLVPAGNGTATITGGTTVTRVSGTSFVAGWVGRTFTAGGEVAGSRIIDATIATVTDGDHLTLSQSLNNGVGTAFYVTPTQLISSCSGGNITYVDNTPDASLQRGFPFFNSTGGTEWAEQVTTRIFGSDNTAYGTYALFNGWNAGNHRMTVAGTGQGNAKIVVTGGDTLQLGTTPFSISSHGGNNLVAATTANTIAAFGTNIFSSCTTCNNNIGLGTTVGAAIITATGNILIGNSANLSSDSITGALVLGSNVTAAKSTTVYIGNAAAPGGSLKGLHVDVSDSTAPDFSFLTNGRNAWQWGMWRNSSGGGLGLRFYAGAAASGANNGNGGTLSLESGLSTGSGYSVLDFKYYKAGGSGTSDNGLTTFLDADPSHTTTIQWKDGSQQFPTKTYRSQIFTADATIAVNAIVRISTADRVTPVATTDIGAPLLGIAVAACTSGNPCEVAISGYIGALNDAGGTSTAGDFFGVSSGTAGNGTGIGTNPPQGVAYVGQIDNSCGGSPNLCPIVINPGISTKGWSRVTSQFDKNASTAFGNITGLTGTLAAAQTYSAICDLYGTIDAVGGQKYDWNGGSATATTFVSTNTLLDDTTNVYDLASRTTTLAGTASLAGNTQTLFHTRLNATIVVNAAGTLIPRFAQNSASGTSSILVGSKCHYALIP